MVQARLIDNVTANPCSSDVEALYRYVNPWAAEQNRV